MAQPTNQKEKFVQKAGDTDRATLPEVPKIPEAIKAANPKLREAWEQYDAEVERFVKEQLWRIT